MDRLQEEVIRLLNTSGYPGISYLYHYLKPFIERAKKDGHSPQEIESLINKIVDDFTSAREGWV